MTTKPKVLISILNWNKVHQTLACLSSLAEDVILANAEVTVLVIDNGSKAEDVALLEVSASGKGFSLCALPTNLGFTGGHNVAMQIAIDETYDFIWLLNNDATVEPGALAKLLATMHSDLRCGAASPVIRDSIDAQLVTSCLGTHEWHKRDCKRIVSLQEGKRIQAEWPEAVWLVGTAILFRVKALKEVGMLDDRLFAYWDDNDMGARLAAAGWISKCVFAASVAHDTRSIEHHPLYVYYLFQRNEMLFWKKNMPNTNRRLLWLKLVDTALFDVNRLYRMGLKSQGDAALLGVFDFICHRFGPPKLNRKVPFLLRVMCKMSALINEKKVCFPTVEAPN